VLGAGQVAYSGGASERDSNRIETAVARLILCSVPKGSASTETMSRCGIKEVKVVGSDIKTEHLAFCDT
jgi:hypothetical protein